MTRPSGVVTRIEGMGARPFSGLIVESFDVCLELIAIDPPDAPAAYLDGGKSSGPHQRVHLRNAHAEIDRHVLEGHETGFHGRGLAVR